MAKPLRKIGFCGLLDSARITMVHLYLVQDTIVNGDELQ